MRSIILIFVSFILVSCERETEIKIPHSEPKIAVSCFLTPRKNVELYICKSIHIDDTHEKPVTDAIVELYQNDELLITVAHEENGFYRSEMQPQTGNNYSLVIHVPGFETLTAKTFIPKPVVIDTTEINRIIGTSESGKTLSNYKIFFTSDNSTTKYFQYLFKACTDSINVFGNVCLGNTFSYDASIMEEGDIYSNVFSNILFNDSINSLNLFFEDPIDLFYNVDSIEFTISAQIYSLSKELYLYEKSLKRYYENQNSIWEQNNPPLIYSNVENGYGVFAGVSYSQVIVERIIEATK